MPDDAEQTPAGEGAPGLAALRDLNTHCDMRDVRVGRILAEIADPSNPTAVATPIVHVDYEFQTAFLCDKGLYGNKFDYSFGLQGADGEEVARIEFSILLDFVVPADYEPDFDAAGEYAESIGQFAAFPYARELLQTITTRLGLRSPVRLGLLKRGDSKQPTPKAFVAVTDFADELLEEPF